jgi:hypothetical protein
MDVNLLPPICRAARAGDVEALRRELDAGVSPDEMGSAYRNTPLSWLCLKAYGDESGGDRIACVKLLIDRGANVNAHGESRATPLFYSVGCHHGPELGRLLLDAGADPNAQSPLTSRTALHNALHVNKPEAPAGFVDLVQALIRAGLDVNLRDKWGRTALEAGNLSPDVALRIYPIMFRAGAALRSPSPESDRMIYARRPHVATTLAHYVQKIQDAGGFKRYERNHLNALTNTFAPKLPVLPPELVRRVVEYAFHVGDY